MNYKILVLLITTLIIQSYAQSIPCKNYKFKQNLPNAFKTCIDLPQLGSSLHYTYNPTNATLEIAYRHPGYSPGVSKWVAWAINPTAKGMVGSQTLVGLRNPKDGSIMAYTSPINSYGTKLEKGELSFEVTGLKAELINEEMIIFANIKIPDNKTEINQVWNEGGLSDVGNPKMHFATNVHSMASLNVLSGVLDHNAGSGSKGIDASTLRWIHGTINGVSWGILIPVGTLIARHVRVIFPSADPAWFYLHVGCQLSAYILGTVGFIIGLKLTSGAHHVHHPIHRYLGIAIFSVATLQMSALLYRPKKDDANRKYWSTIHHLNGHFIEIMGIINIFRGLKLIYIDHDTWIINFIIYVIIITAVHIGLNILSLVIVAKRNKSQSAPLDFIFFKL